MTTNNIGFESTNRIISDNSIIISTIKKSLTKLLVGRVFVGEYAERHYVDSLATYRDLVVVGPEETELRKTLLEAIKIVQNALRYSVWFGVTGNEHDQTPKGYCLWVNLTQVPLGKHWFHIESVDSAAGEILLKLKHLRPFDAKSQPTKEKTNSAELVDDFNLIKSLQEVQFSEVLNFGTHAALNASSWCILNLKNVLTYKNICETITFTSVFILAVGSFLVEAAKFLCDYSIKLIHEFSILMRSLTPIILGLIEFFAKCVGGFYLLIVMLWRGSTGPSPHALGAAFESRKAIGYTSQAQNKYPYAQRVPQPRGRFSNAW